METPELKPCPFCGGIGRILVVHKGVKSIVYCTTPHCGFERVSWNNGDTDEHARQRLTAAWNRRPTSEDLKYKECRYYTENSFWGGGCLGTKEIDPCVGASCKCWKPKEDNDGNA